MKTFLFLVSFMMAFACANHSTPALAAQEEVTQVSVAADVSGSLNNKHLKHYQVASAGNDVYCFWIKVSGLTHSNPCASGDIVLSVDIQPNESAENIGYAFQNGLYAYLDNLDIEAQWATIGVTNVNDGNDQFDYMMFYTLPQGACQDASAGDTGWAVSVTQQGQD